MEHTTAQDLLNELTRRGVRVTTNGEKLVVEPLSKVEEPEREAIKRHKPELLALLRNSASPDAPKISPRVVESLQRKAVESLTQSETLAYAVAADMLQPGDVVPLAIAIRGKAVAVLAIPRERFDLAKILDALDEHNDGARFVAAIH